MPKPLAIEEWRLFDTKSTIYPSTQKIQKLSQKQGVRQIRTKKSSRYVSIERVKEKRLLVVGHAAKFN